MPTLPICQLRLARQDIMAFHRTSAFLLITFLLSNAFTLRADVGTRHTLLVQRSALLEQLQRSQADTTGMSRDRSDSLQAAIIGLDHAILMSYEQTLSRISAQQRRRSLNDRLLTLFALGCCIVALGAVLALWLAKDRVHRQEGVGLMTVYRQLYDDLLRKTAPIPAAYPALRRVSPVVILGILGMMLSVMVYLADSLH